MQRECVFLKWRIIFPRFHYVDTYFILDLSVHVSYNLLFHRYETDWYFQPGNDCGRLILLNISLIYELCGILVVFTSWLLAPVAPPVWYVVDKRSGLAQEPKRHDNV